MSESLDKLSYGLVEKALVALFKFEVNKEAENTKNLFNDFGKKITLQIQLLKPYQNTSLRPVNVPIPHSLFSTEKEEHSICLFCRSPDKTAIEEFLVKNPVEGLTKVVSINEVKKFYHAFKDKQTLLKAHTHFLCDERVFTHLTNLLGVTFGKKTHYPVPIHLKPDFSNLTQVVSTTVNENTFLYKSGCNVSVHFGLTSMTVKDVLENIKTGLPVAVKSVEKGWKNVHSLYLKTNTSPALPIYSKYANEIMDFVQKSTGVVDSQKPEKKKKKSLTPTTPTPIDDEKMKKIQNKRKRALDSLAQVETDSLGEESKVVVGNSGKKAVKTGEEVKKTPKKSKKLKAA